MSSLSFRDFFLYVVPGTLYLVAVLVWFPDILKIEGVSSVLGSVAFLILAYIIGFSTYGLSYAIRRVLKGWKDEDAETIKKLIRVMHLLPNFYNGEVFRYRNLCRASMALALPTLATGVSLSLRIWCSSWPAATVILAAAGLVSGVSLYRAIRYNTRYLSQIDYAYAIAKDMPLTPPPSTGTGKPKPVDGASSESEDA